MATAVVVGVSGGAVAPVVATVVCGAFVGAGVVRTVTVVLGDVTGATLAGWAADDDDGAPLVEIDVVTVVEISDEPVVSLVTVELDAVVLEVV